MALFVQSLFCKSMFVCLQMNYIIFNFFLTVELCAYIEYRKRVCRLWLKILLTYLLTYTWVLMMDSESSTPIRVFKFNFCSLSEVFIQIGSDVIEIYLQAIISFYDRFWQINPNFLMMVHWYNLSIFYGFVVIRLFQLGWEMPILGQVWGVLGTTAPPKLKVVIINHKIHSYSKLHLLSHHV